MGLKRVRQQGEEELLTTEKPMAITGKLVAKVTGAAITTASRDTTELGDSKAGPWA